MKFDLSFVLLFLTILVILCCHSSTAHGADVLQQCADANLHKVNEYRRSRGLGSLTMNSEARRRAEAHTKQMASSDHLYHSDGSVFMDYENVAQNWMTTGEDLDEVGAKLFQQWKESPGHNKNMLRDDTKYAGIACVAMSGDYMQKIYATQIFWRSAYGGEAEQPGRYPPSSGDDEHEHEHEQIQDEEPPIVVDKRNGGDNRENDEDGNRDGNMTLYPTKKPRTKKYRYGNQGGKSYPTGKPESQRKRKEGGNRRRNHRYPQPSKEPKEESNDFHYWFWHNWWYHDGGDNKYNDKKDGGNQWHFKWL